MIKMWDAQGKQEHAAIISFKAAVHSLQCYLILYHLKEIRETNHK